jgi:hypothetical protein
MAAQMVDISDFSVCLNELLFRGQVAKQESIWLSTPFSWPLSDESRQEVLSFFGFIVLILNQSTGSSLFRALALVLKVSQSHRTIHIDQMLTFKPTSLN